MWHGRPEKNGLFCENNKTKQATKTLWGWVHIGFVFHTHRHTYLQRELEREREGAGREREREGGREREWGEIEPELSPNPVSQKE